jgi:hypothetical protein
MTQVPKNPPPWGPRRDPHFDATHTFEGHGVHTQVDVGTAILKGWWFRPEWYSRLIPDTRRCRFHGEIMYEATPLTQDQLDLLYTDQNRGMATGPMSG